MTQHFTLPRPWADGNSPESCSNPIAIEMSKTRFEFKELYFIAYYVIVEISMEFKSNEIFQQNETSVEIAKRKNLVDIVQILENYPSQNSRNLSKQGNFMFGPYHQID